MMTSIVDEGKGSGSVTKSETGSVKSGRRLVVLGKRENVVKKDAGTETEEEEKVELEIAEQIISPALAIIGEAYGPEPLEPEEDADDSDDGLVIDELGLGAEETVGPEEEGEPQEEEETVAEGDQVTSTSQSPPDVTKTSTTSKESFIPPPPPPFQEEWSTPSILPIAELKRKLSFCSTCGVQHRNHKLANLCLSRHGNRQCWLCLQVMSNNKDSYLRHCVDHHAISLSSNSREPIVKCPYCEGDRYFDFRQGFNQHIVKVHFSEDTSSLATTACLSPKSLVDIYTGQPRKEDNEVSTTTITINTGISGEVEVNPQTTEGGKAGESFLSSSSGLQLRSSGESGGLGEVMEEEEESGRERDSVIVLHKEGLTLSHHHSHHDSLYHPPHPPYQEQESVVRVSHVTRTCGPPPGLRTDTIRVPRPRVPWTSYYPPPPPQLIPSSHVAPESLLSRHLRQGQGEKEDEDEEEVTITLLGDNNKHPSPVNFPPQPQHQQYLTSVNNMLRTMAECQSQSEGNNARKELPAFPCPQADDIFKYPPPRNVVGSAAGVKRRILSKWDEHHRQEIVRGTTLPSPSPSSSPFLPPYRSRGTYSGVVPSPSMTPTVTHRESDLIPSSQVQIHTGLNPLSNLLAASSSEGSGRLTPSMMQVQVPAVVHPFAFHRLRSGNNEVSTTPSSAFARQTQYYSWEQHQKESASVLYSSHTHTHSSYQSSLDHHYQNMLQLFRNQYDNRAQIVQEQIHHPEVNKRPGLGPQFLTACQVDHGSVVLAELGHSQYQHKILRQMRQNIAEVTAATAVGAKVTSKIQDTGQRRRKSSTPIRLVPPTRTYESIVVQNPFDEEDEFMVGPLPPPPQSPGRKKAPSRRVSHSPSLDFESGETMEQPGFPIHVTLNSTSGRPSASAYIQTPSSSPVPPQIMDQFASFEPKFTSGGSLIEYSRRNVYSFSGSRGSASRDGDSTIGMGGKRNGSRLGVTTVATNLGVLTTDNESIRVGVGLLGPPCVNFHIQKNNDCSGNRRQHHHHPLQQQSHQMMAHNNNSSPWSPSTLHHHHHHFPVGQVQMQMQFQRQSHGNNPTSHFQTLGESGLGERYPLSSPSSILTRSHIPVTK